MYELVLHGKQQSIAYGECMFLIWDSYRRWRCTQSTLNLHHRGY